jgi:hypothetical protein
MGFQVDACAFFGHKVLVRVRYICHIPYQDKTTPSNRSEKPKNPTNPTNPTNRIGKRFVDFL